ncbi:MAG: cell division topological specificity factor MinE [Bdellovibrionales bacterium]|nr:cell division topological specificity factor MinE [Bdellovibrionales bacterium]
MFGNITTRFFKKNLSTVTAKNRLQMVLVQDRSGMSNKEMELFKKDLLDVIAKYFVIEKKHLEVNWQRNEQETALVINTPVTGRLKAAKKRAAAG